MKRILLASAAVMVAAVTTASAVPAGWYVGADVGMNWLQNTSPNTALGNQLHTDFNNGWALSGSIGYRWVSGFRGEFEAGYRHNQVDSIRDTIGAFTGPGGNVSQFALMANALYDFELSPSFMATVGGGIGAASANFDARGAGVNRIRDNDDDWSFAFQLMAGLGYHVTERTDVFVQYSYFANNDHEVVTYPNGLFPQRDSVDLDSNTVSVGVRFGLTP